MADLLKTFVIGGGLIAGAKYVSQFMSPAWAGMVGGLPTGIIASFFLDSDKKKIMYYSGYVYSSFLLFVAVVFCHIITTHFQNIPINVVSTIAIPLWAIVSYLVIQREFPKK